jgi:hypothetical protein
MKNPQTDILKVMIRDVDSWAASLQEFLIRNSVEIDSRSLYHLVDAVKELKVKLNDVEYAGLIYDDNGYITGAFRLGDFAEIKTLPIDVTQGYYKYVNGVFIIDEERQRQLEEV